MLLEGLPGLAKSLTVQSLAEALGGTYRRIQFTPDLLPADLLGTQVYNPQTGEWSVREGPVFGNFVLADEINRAPAKVQSALLEAMEERQVTLAGRDARAARALPRARHAEPGRARGHVPAARGADRPLHAEGRRALPVARRTSG